VASETYSGLSQCKLYGGTCSPTFFFNVWSLIIIVLAAPSVLWHGRIFYSLLELTVVVVVLVVFHVNRLCCNFFYLVVGVECMIETFLLTIAACKSLYYYWSMIGKVLLVAQDDNDPYLGNA